MVSLIWLFPILQQGQIWSIVRSNRKKKQKRYYKVIKWEKLATYHQIKRRFLFLTSWNCLPHSGGKYMYTAIILNISFFPDDFETRHGPSGTQGSQSARK